MKTNIFERLSFYSLSLVIILLPLFCLPFTKIPIETSKGLLLVIGLALSVIFWAIARFSDGRIIFPRSWLLLSGFGIILAVLLSTIFSGNSQVSLFGTMFDIGSFWFILGGFVLMVCSSVIFRTSGRARTVLFGVILSSALVLIFQSIHLFFPSVLSLGILSDKTGNVLGSWNTLGLFAGFSGLVYLLIIEFFSISKIEKIILQIFLLLSVLLMMVVNFPLVWMLFGASSLIIFIYKVSINLENNEGGGEEGEKKYFPITPFVAMIISLVLFMSSGVIGNIVPNRLQISNNEVSPSFSTTMYLTKGVLSKNPVFGTGPNRFGEAWSMYKPVSINNTQFWDTTFDSGSGLLPTLTATTGGLGILAWVIFIVLLLYVGVKSVFPNIKNKANWEVMAFFVFSLYLFLSSLLYPTGPVMFLLALAFTGVFIGLSASNRTEGEISISLLNDPRKSFFSILFLIAVIIASVAVSFKYAERFTSVFYFGRAVFATTEPVAEDSIGKALSLYQNDLYLRTLSQISIAKLNSLVKKGGSLSDTDKVELQASLDKAINTAQMATTYDSKNYLNFVMLGSVYQVASSLGAKDAYDKAIEAYQTASTLNPSNPGLKLAMANASFMDGKVKEAKDFANAALALKPGYVDALIVLSQIAKSEGDNKSALSYAQNALSLTPGDKDLIQYIDSLNQK